VLRMRYMTLTHWISPYLHPLTTTEGTLYMTLLRLLISLPSGIY